MNPDDVLGEFWRWLACRPPGRHARRRAAVTRIRDVDPAAWNGDPR